MFQRILVLKQNSTTIVGSLTVTCTAYLCFKLETFSSCHRPRKHIVFRKCVRNLVKYIKHSTHILDLLNF